MSANAAVRGPKQARPTPQVTVAALDPALTAGRGATVNFVEQEAENAVTNGTIIGPDTTAYTLAAEASGRMAVKLDSAGQFVEFTLTQDANAITVRYSIPDAPTGGGIDAPITLTAKSGRARVEVKTLTLTSRFSWFYGAYPFSNDPNVDWPASFHKSEPDPITKPFHPNHFYDEQRVMLDRTYRAGDTIRLTVPESTNAAWYLIDLMDFELVAAALPAPDNSVSVVDFGADPTGAIESSDAFDAAIAAAQSQHKTVFIPVGTFQVNRHILVDNVTIAGAGNWWTIIRGKEVAITPRLPDPPTHTGVGFYGKYGRFGGSSNVHLSGFAIEGDVRERIEWDAVNGIGGALSDSTIDGLYIHHTKVGLWMDGPMNNLAISNSIVVDTMADGVNFCAGITNSSVTNSFFRNNGDDRLAMWSRGLIRRPFRLRRRHRRLGFMLVMWLRGLVRRLPKVPENANNVFDHNTIQTPVLANGIAIYGGRDNTVSNNITADPIREGSGLHAGVRFWSTPFDGCLKFINNTTVRAGTLEMRWGIGLGAIWFFAQEGSMNGRIEVTGDRYLDSTYNAMMFVAGPWREKPGTPLLSRRPRWRRGTGQHTIANVHFKDIKVDGTGTSVVSSRVGGSATCQNVVARNVGAAGINKCGAFGIVDLGGNDGGWMNTTTCDDRPTVVPPPPPSAW